MLDSADARFGGPGGPRPERARRPVRLAPCSVRDLREERRIDARLARSPLPARRHLGRRGGQLRDLLGARDRRRALPLRRRPRTRVAVRAHPAARAHRLRSGTATCPTCGRGSSTATASTGRTSREEGHRFNPAKLLLDPYAKAITGAIDWSDALFGYTVGAPGRRPRSSTRATAPARMPKCVVIDPAFTWGDDRPPRRPWNRTIIYEAHVRGMTMLHPDVPRGAPRHLPRRWPATRCSTTCSSLGVTAVELLPVHQFVDDRHLRRTGLTQLLGLQLDRLLRARRALRDRRPRRAGVASSRRWSRRCTARASR